MCDCNHAMATLDVICCCAFMGLWTMAMFFFVTHVVSRWFRPSYYCKDCNEYVYCDQAHCHCEECEPKEDPE